MKRILDPCCGGRMFYFDKTDERVLFCDKRQTECKNYLAGFGLKNFTPNMELKWSKI